MTAGDREAIEALRRRIKHASAVASIVMTSTSVNEEAADALESIVDQLRGVNLSLETIIIAPGD